MANQNINLLAFGFVGFFLCAHKEIIFIYFLYFYLSEETDSAGVSFNSITKQTFLKSSIEHCYFEKYESHYRWTNFYYAIDNANRFRTIFRYFARLSISSCAELSFVVFFSVYKWHFTTNEVCSANYGDIWVLYSLVLLWIRSNLQNMFKILLHFLAF